MEKKIVKTMTKGTSLWNTHTIYVYISAITHGSHSLIIAATPGYTYATVLKVIVFIESLFYVVLVDYQ